MPEHGPDRPLRVLVVCTANIARSPLAEVMLEAALAAPDLRFASAGVQARDGDLAAQEGIALAAQRGLDLTGHRSTPASDEVLRWADLVLTMTEKHRDQCASRLPGAGERTFTLREFVRLIDDSAPPVDFAGASAGDRAGARLGQLRDAAHAARPRGRRPPEPEDIVDPIGRGEAAWQSLVRDLEDLVDHLERSVQPAAA
jgi:protein-tyrosine phosphatase